MMNKGDLRTGMVVKTRNDNEYVVLCGELPTEGYGTQNTMIVSKDGFMTLGDYNNDMRNINGSKDYDVMSVYKPNICGFNELLKRTAIPLWTRQPEVDWSKVAVDTKVFVGDYEGRWSPRYFCKFVDGRVYTWNNGKASFTTEETMSWKYAKLA